MHIRGHAAALLRSKPANKTVDLLFDFAGPLHLIRNKEDY